MWDQQQYIQAWHFASQAHHGQLIPSAPIPYINHLGLVAMEVMRAIAQTPIANPNLAVVCALLHDTIEDTDTCYNDIQTLFGAAVADGVLALTKDLTLPSKQAAMADSLVRIKQQPRAVWVVKLADRITNLQAPPPHWKTDKIIRYRSEAQSILEALGAANDFLAIRLAKKIGDYEQYCL